MSIWSQSRFFKAPFVVKGKWCFQSAHGFPHEDYLSADTETKLEYDGHILTEDEAYELYKNHNQKWIKMNVEVKAYAFMLSNGESFALFQNADDFLTCCAMMNVKTVFWYNARFDFSIFDYFFLTNEWNDVTVQIAKQDGRYGKFPSGTYQSLNGDFGQRYSMRIWKDYVNRRSQRKVHNFKMIDICNIFGGGLAKNLEDWKIKDHEGRDIRKLEMNYSDANIDDNNDIQYMINDTKGLHLLAEKIDETMKSITGYSLFDGDYLTAGGLAKKTLLKKMFFQHADKENVYAFHLCFPMSPEEDENFRQYNLYLGGKCFVNPHKVGVVQKNIYKYDVNSMYPDKMRNMAYPFGQGVQKTLNDIDRKGHVYILSIKNLYGSLKRGMIPIWQDALTGDYVEFIREPEKRYIWLEELEELQKWYNLDFDVEYVLEYKAVYPKGVKEYVDAFYDIKCTRKGAVKNGAKLLLNSAYGKIAQKLDRELCVYELDEETGTVHLVSKGQDVDENGMLSVVVGSRITSLARVHLLTYIRDISQGDVINNFIYCDTDSVHATVPYDNTDDKRLGMMKCEGQYKYGLYLAPKSYLIYDGEEYEVHCKGVNTNVVANELKGKTFIEACDIFRPNRLFKCLCGLNVKGGKALIYVDKMILNDENMSINTEVLGDLELINDIEDFEY